MSENENVLFLPIPPDSPNAGAVQDKEPRRFAAMMYVTEAMERRFTKEELETAATVVLFHCMACDQEASNDIANEQISLEWVSSFVSMPGFPHKMIRVMAMVQPINSPKEGL